MDYIIYDSENQQLDGCFDVESCALSRAFNVDGLVAWMRASKQAISVAKLTQLNDWKFKLVTTESGKSYANEDAMPGVSTDDWLDVKVPYDWSIRLDFNIDSPGKAKAGYLDGGIGVYRRKVNVDLARRNVLDFEGAYMETSVFVNGKLVKKNYWCNPFAVELNEHCVQGQNDIAVVCRADQPSSRWYSGAGLIRWVTLAECEPAGDVAIGDILVRTPQIEQQCSSGTVTVNVKTQLSRESEAEVKILDRNMAEVASRVVTGKDLDVDIDVVDPELWTFETDSPAIYTVEVIAGQLKKRTEFGFRWYTMTKDGFMFNGKPAKINGVCLHEDLGCVGVESNRSLTRLRLKKMKEMGANSVRTAHSPFSHMFIQECDRVGLMVTGELFDCWFKNRENNIYDFARFFNDHAEEVIETTILRDRNSPSIIMWTIGNEVQIRNYTLDQSKQTIEKLTAAVRRVDPDTPISMGNDVIKEKTHADKIAPYVDILGHNYADDAEYLSSRAWYPDKPQFASECWSSFYTRGTYAFSNDDCCCPSYDTSTANQSKASWGDTVYECYNRFYEKYPDCLGMYIWTGYDYIGEPTPFNPGSNWKAYFPAKSSQFGCVDTAGFEKDPFYKLQSLWTTKPMVHIAPTDWDSWSDGQNVRVDVYSNCVSVELFLNGKSYGKKTQDAQWQKYKEFNYTVRYASGTLSAVGYASTGQVVVQDTVKTSLKEVAGIALEPSARQVAAMSEDYVIIKCMLVDANGVVVAKADDWIEFIVNGPGEFYGADNGKPKDDTNMRSPLRRAFCGKASCVIRPTDEAGVIRIIARLKDKPDVMQVMQVNSTL